MTNGQITKKILVACKNKTGNDLKTAVTALLESFPLSSYKLVYDRDQSKVSPTAWKTLLESCRLTDKAKMEGLNKYLRSLGGSPAMEKKEFGRYSK